MHENHTCAVCGKPIEPNETRYVDVRGDVANAKRHVHTACQKQDRQAAGASS